MVKIHLSRLLGERKMTQADLVRATGIRANTVSEMYHELLERVSIDHLDKICEVLHCDIAELLEYVPNRQPRTGKHLILEEHARRGKHTRDNSGNGNDRDTD